MVDAREVDMIRVNDTTIEEKSVLEEMQYHPAESQQEAMKKAAEALIIGELFKQRARELGFKVTAPSAEAAEHDFVERLIDQEVHIPEANRRGMRALFFKPIASAFTTSPLLEVRHILLAAAPDDNKGRMEALSLAEEVIKQLQTGGDFAGLARGHSSCPSKETGGSLGQLSRGQTVPEFERVVFALEPGLHDSPVESRYGFHVVWVERKVPGQAARLQCGERENSRLLE